MSTLQIITTNTTVSPSALFIHISWRLPTGGSGGEYQVLYTKYNSSALMLGTPNFTLSGYRYGSSTNVQGSNSDYWSSTAYGSTAAYLPYLTKSTIGLTNYDSKYYGCAVRCVAK